MTSVTGKSGTIVRWTGFLAGCLIGVSFVLLGKVPEGRAASGVKLSLSSQPSAQLGVAPAGNPFLEARDLAPGGRPANGQFELSNYTTRELALQAHIQPGDRDLDSLVQVDLTTDNKSVFRGRLAELRSRSAARFALGPKERRQLALRAWLPRSVKHDFQGRSANLQLAIGPVRRGR
jgi:hypothetical protein